MKKLFLILLFSVSVFAQKKRTISFDADTTTRPAAGFYGIGVRDAQPYLVKPSGGALMIKVEEPYIRAWSTGKELAMTLTRDHPTLIFALRDSINFILPSSTDTLNRYVKYDIHYLGWRGGTGANKYVPFDSTCRMSFSDSVRIIAGGNIIYRTKVLDRYGTFPFRLRPNIRFGLEIINNKWYLNLTDFEY